MMDLNFLSNYIIPVVLGICLCTGYVIKTSLPSINNKYIPLIMAILGIFLVVWIEGTINTTVILSGMFTGISSTGLHQIFKNLINKEGE